MKTTIATLLLLLASFTLAVYNGTPLTQGEHAYLVYLMVDNGLNTTYACTGGLINSQYVISAGHCSFGNYFQVIVGRIDVQGYHTTDVVNVTKVTRPSDFAANGVFDYDDIAIFELATPVPEVAGVTEYLNIGLDAPPTGAPLTLAGFGGIGYNEWTTIAHTGVIHVAPNSQCSLYYFRPAVAYCSVDPDVYSCPGDSGSPIVVKPDGSDRWVLVGIDSFGYGGDCGRKLPDGVISKVAVMLDFIRANTQLETPTFVNIAAWGALETQAPSSTTSGVVTTTTIAPTTIAPTIAPTTIAPTTTVAPSVAPSASPSTSEPVTTTITTTAAPTPAPTAESTTLPPAVNPTGAVIQPSDTPSPTIAPVGSTSAPERSSANKVLFTFAALFVLVLSM
jgi:secreted trypsin-like serine protease